MPFNHDEVTGLAGAEIRCMAAVCRDADLGAPVPTCPDWDLDALVRHVGTVNRWAAAMVEQRADRRFRRDDMDWEEPADPVALVAWLEAGAARCETVFAAADPAAEMWAWGWPKTAAFWPRRMLHETTVHRADAELALGLEPAVDETVGADGVDELLDNLPHAAYFAPAVAELRGDGEVLAFATPSAAWRIRLHGDGFAWERAGEGDVDATDATLSLPSSGELLLTLYRRLPVDPTAVHGDAALVERWLAHSSL